MFTYLFIKYNFLLAYQSVNELKFNDVEILHVLTVYQENTYISFLPFEYHQKENIYNR